ncbi:putative uncharacterized protein [Parachlamydia acanthamoebae UV-7]|jgi:DNA-binding transcriptional LysR family regulator|uniref:HTH lysR-type domain-containing protein n=2 Tax=Parachlamydia acanthamoebae TaxID=83552 RepID=F8KXA4_PARAV|nr:LysR family transcriptional regulator [Parachlamydia acanthamoebae]EFB41386.1 hypothetical protein pah_c045o100 [Parachlamydia acanthamoebae str. Hall's coccus]CCB85575.1 putative uncharacterized protein [Parachlamydia acanthamoebae UV-7]
MNPHLNLLHLKYFCDAVNFNSISEAAKANFVTQSAVSQAISKLEISLGAKVIVHSRQKFQITEEGKIVFEQARHIFTAVQAIHEKIHYNKEGVNGVVKFVSTNSLGMFFIAPMYKKMQAQFPSVSISYKLGGLNLIRSALRQGEAEFAIVVNSSEFTDFSKRLLRKGVFQLYQHVESHPQLFEKGILIDYAESMYIASLQEYMLQANQQQLKIQAELAAWEVVARFTEMNIGIGFFPDYIVANNRYTSLKVFPIDLPIFEYEICAIYNKGHALSRPSCAFLDQFFL